MEGRRPSADMMAGMAEEFMTNWTSDIFRDRCIAQIDSVRQRSQPQTNSDDPVEKFLAEKTSEQLEQFVFEKSDTREDYVSLIAEMMMMLRQHAGRPAVDSEVLKNTPPEVLAKAEATVNEMNGHGEGEGGASAKGI